MPDLLLSACTSSLPLELQQRILLPDIFRDPILRLGVRILSCCRKEEFAIDVAMLERQAAIAFRYRFSASDGASLAERNTCSESVLPQGKNGIRKVPDTGRSLDLYDESGRAVAFAPQRVVFRNFCANLVLKAFCRMLLPAMLVSPEKPAGCICRSSTK